MPRQYDEDLFTDSTMTFGEHLEELRICLFKAIIGFAVGMVVGLLPFVGGNVVKFIQSPLTRALTDFYEKESKANLEATSMAEGTTAEQKQRIQQRTDELIEKRRMLGDVMYFDPADLVRQLKARYPEQCKALPDLPPASVANEEGGLMPMVLWRQQATDPRLQIKSFSVQEGFAIYLKASLLVGAILSSPWVFYQLWSFVAAGLYPHEKRYVHLYLPISLGLFFLGASVVFLFIFKPVLTYLFWFNSWLGIDPDPRISEWMGFVLLLPVGFGIGFQLPLVMYFLERVGVFSIETYLKYWRGCVMVIVILAGILTPPDPYSIMFLAGPLVILFFGGVLLCKFMPQPKRKFEAWD
jgi:sec-independent protein translocase protein TatC